MFRYGLAPTALPAQFLSQGHWNLRTLVKTLEARHVSVNEGILVIGEDTILRAKVRNCRHLEVFGYVDGEVDAEKVLVHRGGRVFGTVSAGSADISGTLQGRVGVRQLIAIRSTGEVSGTVRYGQMAMEAGGSLSAEVRNVPPALAGDFELAVARGDRVQIRQEDLQAVDPDDDSGSLVFSVTNVQGGHLARAEAIDTAVAHFTQADLDSGRIYFRHNGDPEPEAGFDIEVSDHTGQSSGAPQHVRVIVRG